MLSPAQTIRAQRPLTKSTLLLTSTLTVMAGATVSPSLPAMRAAFSDTPQVDLLVRLVLTLPALFIVIGAPLAGGIVDRYGRKPLLLASTLLYAVAGGSGFVLDSLSTILVGRAFLGLAVAGLMTAVTTLIADYYSGPSRATFLGYQAAFMGFGGTLFLSLAGFLADVSWRYPFLIYLSAAAIGLLVWLALFEPDTQPELSPAGSLKATARFTPSIQSVLPQLALIYTLIVLLQIIFFLVPVQLPFFLEELLAADATRSGLAVSAIAFTYAAGSLFSGRVGQRLGHGHVILLAFGITGIGYGLIGSGGSYPLILLGLLIGGLGFGLVLPNLTVWLADISPEALRGRLLGGLTTAVFLGQFLSPIVTQPLTNLVGYANTYLATAGLLGVLWALSLILTLLRR